MKFYIFRNECTLEEYHFYFILRKNGQFEAARRAFAYSKFIFTTTKVLDH